MSCMYKSGANNMGLTAIKFAKHMEDKVITTVDSPEKYAFVRRSAHFLRKIFILDLQYNPMYARL